MYVLCRDHDRRVYHLTSSSEFKITWAEIIEKFHKIVRDEVPFNRVAWYPVVSMKKSRLINNICVILFHMIPAYLIDALIFFSGNKPV